MSTSTQIIASSGDKPKTVQAADSEFYENLAEISDSENQDSVRT